jgi:murein DD-endopeptidase MepM/ murein hydrolase activator NlpD
LEDHYSWNQPVYATAGGKVAYAAYDMPDLQPGIPPDPRLFRDDIRRLLGNAVAISHANGEFSYYGHLQQLSLQVNEGEMIKRGTLLGYVGNSGNSPGPHLHFHLMEGPNIFIDRGLPVRFSNFWAGGQFFGQPTFIPTRMIVVGPERGSAKESH